MGTMRGFLKDLINSISINTSVMHLISKLDDELLEENLRQFKIGVVVVFMDDGRKLAFRNGHKYEIDFSKIDKDCLIILNKLDLLTVDSKMSDSFEFKLSDKGKDYLKKFKD